MYSLTPRFSSNRMLREYTEMRYIPALADFKMRNEDGGELARNLVQWQTQLADYGNNIHWGDLRIEQHAKSTSFVVHVYLGDVSVDYIEVQLLEMLKTK